MIFAQPVGGGCSTLTVLLLVVVEERLPPLESFSVTITAEPSIPFVTSLFHLRLDASWTFFSWNSFKARRREFSIAMQLLLGPMAETSSNNSEHATMTSAKIVVKLVFIVVLLRDTVLEGVQGWQVGLVTLLLWTSTSIDRVDFFVYYMYWLKLAAS